MTPQLNARIDDELAEYLDGVENKSETVREALRWKMYQEEGVDDSRLSEDQRAAYEWFRRYAGVGESVDLGVARTVLAQRLSLDKEIVTATAIRPLDRFGYVDVQARMHDVRVVVRPPVRVDEREAGTATDDPSGAADRLDELAGAETSAD